MIKIITVLTTLVISVMALDTVDSDLRRDCTRVDIVYIEKKEIAAEEKLKVLETEKMHLEQTIKIITKASEAKLAELKLRLEMVTSNLQEVYTWRETKYEKMSCKLKGSDVK